MSYLVVRLKEGVVMSKFEDLESARAAQRRANAMAGWSRVAREWCGAVELEWCRASNGLAVHKLGPYAVTTAECWEQSFSETQRWLLQNHNV